MIAHPYKFSIKKILTKVVFSGEKKFTPFHDFVRNVKRRKKERKKERKERKKGRKKERKKERKIERCKGMRHWRW